MTTSAVTLLTTFAAGIGSGGVRNDNPLSFFINSSSLAKNTELAALSDQPFLIRDDVEFLIASPAISNIVYNPHSSRCTGDNGIYYNLNSNIIKI
jgi:hypothetical protein